MPDKTKNQSSEQKLVTELRQQLYELTDINAYIHI